MVFEDNSLPRGGFIYHAYIPSTKASTNVIHYWGRWR